MKIVHVCTTAPWHERYAYQENLLPQYHKLLGHDVTILAPVYSIIGYSKNGIVPPGNEVLNDGTKVVRLLPLVKNIFIDSHLHLVKGLKRTILDERPDLLFIHDVCSFNFVCVREIKKKIPHLKIVMDNHSDLVNSLHSPLTKILHRYIYRYILIPRLINDVEVFYGVTPSRCSFLRDVYHIPIDKIKLLVMGADDMSMQIELKTELRKKTRTAYDIKDDDFLIVTGGKIDKMKNIHVLAKAVNRLKMSNVKLLIFGKIDEDVQELLDAEISNNVIMIGWINSSKVYEYFYASDLIVFPGLHSVLWEQAVASGTPCAFSYIKGFDHVQVNENCILMEKNTEEYYIALIKKTVTDKIYYSRLKENSGSPLLQQFYYSRIAQQVFEDISL